jgi:hypothetical protein
MNYKEIFEKSMPVTFDSVGVEDGHEVERMWLADMVDGKWIEDYVVVRRDAYDTVTDADGAVFALIENGRMLVKAPNVKHYRIPESVYRIAAHAFCGCTELTDIDVPYSVSEYEIENALEHSHSKMHIHAWDWLYDNTRSAKLEKEIAEGWTDEYGFVYGQDRKRLLKAATVDTYWIPEGVECIDRLAFVHCTFRELHIPYTCNLEKLTVDEYPIFGSDRVRGCIYPWDKPYSEGGYMAKGISIST